MQKQHQCGWTSHCAHLVVQWMFCLNAPEVIEQACVWRLVHSCSQHRFCDLLQLVTEERFKGTDIHSGIQCGLPIVTPNFLRLAVILSHEITRCPFSAYLVGSGLCGYSYDWQIEQLSQSNSFFYKSGHLRLSWCYRLCCSCLQWNLGLTVEWRGNLVYCMCTFLASWKKRKR